MPTLAIRGLRRRLGDRDVVGRLDLELAEGERVALRGPNGSGKTTVLRCVLGTLAPTAGAVEVCGLPAGSTAARARVGAALSQDRSFYLRLTGRDNLIFFARLRRRSRAEAVREVDALIEELELADITSRRVDRCSTGMTQQVGFARGLLGDPDLLLLDEPTRSLDDGAIERMWAAIDRRPHAAVMIATHHDDDAARCGSQLDLPL